MWVFVPESAHAESLACGVLCVLSLMAFCLTTSARLLGQGMYLTPSTKEAKAAKFQGTLILLTTVELDGGITHIRVLKGAGFGLDESAIATLKKWKCKAATGPEGKPVRAEVPFQFNFDYG